MTLLTYSNNVMKEMEKRKLMRLTKVQLIDVIEAQKEETKNDKRIIKEYRFTLTNAINILHSRLNTRWPFIKKSTLKQDLHDLFGDE